MQDLDEIVRNLKYIDSKDLLLLMYEQMVILNNNLEKITKAINQVGMKEDD